MAHLPPGRAHASQVVGDATEREALSNTDKPQNHRRFASLAVMYGWMMAQDHQFIYEKATGTVYSVDHGHFLPGGPDWTPASLSSHVGCEPDPQITAAVPQINRHLAHAKASLDSLTDEVIAQAIVRPPLDWNLADEDREHLAQYLSARRVQMSDRLEELINGA